MIDAIDKLAEIMGLDIRRLFDDIRESKRR